MTAPVKAFLRPEFGIPIPCLFNPNEIKISRTNQWNPKESPGGDVPKLEFGKSVSGTMSLSLMFDTTAEGIPVSIHTTALLQLMERSPALLSLGASRNSSRPPWVVFHWGGLASFKMVVTSLKISFTYFGFDGTPLRAKADLELQQFEPESFSTLQNPTSHTPHARTVHRVQAGETLDRIAAKHYGDPNRWRQIAEANGIIDPLNLEPGTDLVLPNTEVVARG